MSLLAFLVYALVIIVACAVAWAIVNYLPDPPVTAPFKNLIRVVLLLVLLVFLLGWVFGGWTVPAPPWGATRVR